MSSSPGQSSTESDRPANAPETERAPGPPLILLLGPAGSGKTQAAFHGFIEGGDRALLVVPSSEQADNCAQRIAELAGRPAAELRARVTTFPALVTDINRTARDSSDRRSSGRVLQRLALVDLLPKVIHADDFLGPMRDAPGFVSALAERIREWKLACIAPDDLDRGAEVARAGCDPNFERKLRELARLFRQYETFLMQNRLCDAEDELRRAISVVEAAAAPLPHDASRLYVDGFYRFTRAQRRLLAAIAARGVAAGSPETSVTVTLPYEAERPLLFGASERTLRTFRTEFTVRAQSLPPRTAAASPILGVLERRLFSPVTDLALARTPGGAPRPILFDAPNPYVEVELVARAFRRIHETEGVPWGEFAVILRSLGDYAPILSAVFERYGVPIGMDGSGVVAENPFVQTILSLLAIVQNGWQRDDLLSFLKSSYTAPDKLSADGFRRRAQSGGVREGRDRWLKLVERPGVDAALAETVREIARVDERLRGAREGADVFAEELRALLITFGLEERIVLGEKDRRERDWAAHKAASEILKALVEMSELVRRGPVPFETFHAELVAAWRNASYACAPSGDVVRVVEPYDSRRFAIRIAAVIGLTERVFPRRVTEDPFLRDEERAALRTHAGLDLDAQRDRADDERLFFYQAVTAPSERLYLSYPRSSDESDTLPSFYLDEVRAVLPAEALETVSRTLADVAPQPKEAVSDGDRLLAACADLFNPGLDADPRARSEKMLGAQALLGSCLAVNSAETRAVLASRGLPRLPRLAGADLRQAFGRQDRVFSVSELETYSRCAFQYLLRHVWRLEPDEDGAGMRFQGTILHSVLRRYYRRRARAGDFEGQGTGLGAAKVDPGSVEQMRQELRGILEKTLKARPVDASPHRCRMMERLLTDALDRFAEREHRFAAQFGFTPAFFELAFGAGVGNPHFDEDDDRAAELDANGNAREAVYDPASRPQPLHLRAFDNGPPVAVCGVIDRVDLDSTGLKALALDYKLGKPPDWPTIQRGASLQLPLYLLAIERVFGLNGAVACYDAMHETGRRRIQRTEHVPSRQFAPLLPLDTPPTVAPLTRDQWTELVTTVEASSVRAVRGMAEGAIDARPADHCSFCPYGDVCRTTLLGGHDGERRPAEPPPSPAA